MARNLWWNYLVCLSLWCILPESVVFLWFLYYCSSIIWDEMWENFKNNFISMAHKEVFNSGNHRHEESAWNLSNGESRIKNTKTMQLHNLFMLQCMLGAMDELWLVHPNAMQHESVWWSSPLLRFICWFLMSACLNSTDVLNWCAKCF